MDLHGPVFGVALGGQVQPFLEPSQKQRIRTRFRHPGQALSHRQIILARGLAHEVTLMQRVVHHRWRRVGAVNRESGARPRDRNELPTFNRPRHSSSSLQQQGGHHV
jgi:hypothetical protein